MTKPSQVLLAALAAWAVVLLLLCAAAPRGADAVTACDATQLTPCAGAIIIGRSPSAACCSRLKEQQPCLCTYARDPNLQRYVNSPNGKKAMAACKVPVPSC
uniref:Nonspecific lipid-transfer protein n=1 Tax=Zea mays TaxID=4577 RepID=B6UFS4_MAIZE|nr:nonspecific lipid-transfer protein precursor [Zea mays]